MYKLKKIKHANISKSELHEIIKIKSISWPYSFENQINWLKENITDSDLHLILMKDNVSVAYLNLINIRLEIDKKIFDAFGIGNVCSIEKGMGYGGELIKQTNNYIKLKNRTGLLFCKDELIKFYKINDWKLVDKSLVILPFCEVEINAMIYNSFEIRNEIKYNGRLF